MQKQLLLLWILLATDAFAMLNALKQAGNGVRRASYTPTFAIPTSPRGSGVRQLHTEFRTPPITPEEHENADRIRQATSEAHRQTLNAIDVVENQHIPENRQKLESSFGPNVQSTEVGRVLNRLKDSPFVVESASTQPAIDKGVKLAAVPIGRGLDGHPYSDPALIGPLFHTQSEKNRAGTIAHEATHQIAFTGDHVGPNHNIIPAGDKKTHVEIQNGGYRDHPQHPEIKEKSTNMHQNADSFRDFLENCSRRMAKRALLEDDPVSYYLEKRQSCRLPPRKPVTAPTTTPQTKTPASPASPVSNASKAPVKAASTSPKTTTAKAGTAASSGLQRGGTLAPKAARAAEQAAKATRAGATPVKKGAVAAPKKGPATPVKKAASTPARKAPATPAKNSPASPAKKASTPSRNSPAAPAKKPMAATKKSPASAPAKKGPATPASKPSTPARKAPAAPAKQPVAPAKKAPAPPAKKAPAGNKKVTRRSLELIIDELE